MPHSRQTSLVDNNTLLDFYQLKTMSPESYQQDTIPPKVTLDLTQTDLDKVPKETVYRFLSNGADVDIDPHQSARDSKLRSLRDPLGFEDSLLDELIDKDVVDDSRDPRGLKYMIGSKSFNSALFLSTLHGDKSAKELKRSIDFLERDIESKKPMLQQLIAANFTKNLYTKNSLDKVFGEYQESNLGQELATLKKSLSVSSGSSNQLLNPILVQLSKEQEVQRALDSIKENKQLLDLPAKLSALIRENDFYTIMTEYRRGQSFYEKRLAKDPTNPFLGKVWGKVQDILNKYKKQLWVELGQIRIENVNVNYNSNLSDERFITLIQQILELGTDENPIVHFITVQFDYTCKDIEEGLGIMQFARLRKVRQSMDIAYRKNEEKDNDDLSFSALRYVYSTFTQEQVPDINVDGDVGPYDLPMVIELWNYLGSYVTEIADDIIDLKIIKLARVVQYLENEFPKRAASDRMKKFVVLQDYERKKIREFFDTLIAKVCTRLLFIFEATGDELAQSALPPDNRKSRVKDYSVQSSYGFIPPHANVVSALYFSTRLQQKIFNTLQTMKTRCGPCASSAIDDAITRTLKSINQNIVRGVLCTLNYDIERLPFIEDWTLSERLEGCTKLPEFLLNYYKVFITGLKDLMLINDKPLFQKVQVQFLRSFDLLVENQLKAVISKSRENPEMKDFYFITALSNLSALKPRAISPIVSTLDQEFGTSLSSSGLKVYKALDNFDLIIYDNFMKGYRNGLKTIITKGIRSKTWYQMKRPKGSTEPVHVSNFVLQTINFINTIKSRLISLNASRVCIHRVELDLDNFLISKLIDMLKEIRQFNSDGLLQICVDLEFLCEIFRSLKQHNSHNEIKLSTLENVTTRFIQKKNSEQQLILGSVKQNLLENKAQMECFFGDLSK